MALSKFSAEDSSEGLMAEINITPLTDIFLVLLIIFMITTSVMVESAAKVNLPKATPDGSGGARLDGLDHRRQQDLRQPDAGRPSRSSSRRCATSSPTIRRSW